MEYGTFYFVGITETKEILGFNLTNEEKDKLFYHKPTKSGALSSDGRFYGMTYFRVKNQEELDLILKLRKSFKNVRYSYVMLNDNNEWVASGQKETEKQLIDTIHEVRDRYNNPHLPLYIYEVTNSGIKV